MSVGKIALGVLLGNLAFAMIAWLVLAFVFQGRIDGSMEKAADVQYQQMMDRQNSPGVAKAR